MMSENAIIVPDPPTHNARTRLSTLTEADFDGFKRSIDNTPASRSVRTVNHLEQLTSEWLQYCGYFVRTGIQVGPRPSGGFEGELDVVGLHPTKLHLIHIECSLDGKSWVEREKHFRAKFDRGNRFARALFDGFPLPEKLDQVALLQFAGNEPRMIGDVRVVTVPSFINEILRGLANTSPISGAVPSNLPLVRTLQLAADASKAAKVSNAHALLP